MIGRVKGQVNIFGSIFFLPDVNFLSYSFSGRAMNYRLFQCDKNGILRCLFKRKQTFISLSNVRARDYLRALMTILVPRGRASFGQHQESRPLVRSNDIPVLNGFVNTIDWDQNQSDLSDLTLSMCRVTGSPWIADFRCWTWPEVAILGADQKECGLWGREWLMMWKSCAGGMRNAVLSNHLKWPTFVLNILCG